MTAGRPPGAARADRSGNGPDLVTFGETMALLTSPSIGLLRHASTLELSVGGTESNVAIGVQRLGGRAAVITPQSHSMEDAVAIMTGAKQVPEDEQALA